MSTSVDPTTIFREYEIGVVVGLLQGRKSLLEIGGGNGFQAGLLANNGFDVTSVDIRPASRDAQLFPVLPYDGVRLPFESSSFDAVFSSNVLEHVVEFDELMAELRRVLRQGGIAVHIMPSVAWRFWTIPAHYIFVLRRIFGVLSPSSAAAAPARATLARRSFWWVLKNSLIPPAHGEYDSCFSELREYSISQWSRRFRRAGWTVQHVDETGLFYTERTVFPGLELKTRLRLARYLGSACNVFVVTQ